MNMVLGDALSLLLFRLHSGRLLGINLLKVNEIIPCPTPVSYTHLTLPTICSV